MYKNMNNHISSREEIMDNGEDKITTSGKSEQAETIKCSREELNL